MKKLVIVELELEIDDSQTTNGAIAEHVNTLIASHDLTCTVNYCVCRDKFRGHRLNNDTPSPAVG